MKKIIVALFCCAALISGVLCFPACGDGRDGGAVNLVSVTATEVGVRGDIDYFVVPEPAASTKANALPDLNFCGNLQQLYGGDGYPQAVAVAKREIAVSSAAATFVSALKESAAWLLSEEASAEAIVSAVQAHLTAGMTPTFTAKNLTKEVIENCSVKCVAAQQCREEVKDFIKKLNAVSVSSFGEPADGFFVEENNVPAVGNGGEISVYAPDGAPALALARLMAENLPVNGATTRYGIVDASTIQTFVTGASPKADICILPVNLAVKLLGNGEKYKMLATVTHGNLFILSNGKPQITGDSIGSLKGKTVGVVNLAQVPGLTFKTILKDKGIKYKEPA